MLVRTCNTCGKTAQLNEFCATNIKDHKSGKRPLCLSCRKILDKKNRKRRGELPIAEKYLAIKEKACSTCKIIKTIDGFYKSKSTKDKLCNLCKDCSRIGSKKCKESNPEKYLDYNHNYWMQSDISDRREKNNKRYARHYADNKSDYIASAAKRRATELNATPAWADLGKIKEIYRLRQQVTDETGILHHVDHVIPLQGKLVSGLHVHTNLEVIPAFDNLSKKNKF